MRRERLGLRIAGNQPKRSRPVKTADKHIDSAAAAVKRLRGGFFARFQFQGLELFDPLGGMILQPRNHISEPGLGVELYVFDHAPAQSADSLIGRGDSPV